MKNLLFLLITLFTVCVNDAKSQCTPTFNNNCGTKYITSVTLESINNPSNACNGNPNNYIHYPAVGATTTSLKPGKTYSISVSVSTADVNIYCWIDFDQSTVFSDVAGEFIVKDFNSAPLSITKTFTVPVSAKTGQARLRVRGVAVANEDSTSACKTLNNGETEDYTITILKAAVTASSPSICLGGVDTLKSNGGKNYVWSPTTGLTKITDSLMIASPSATTTYTVTSSVGVDSVKVIVNPLPSATITAAKSAICNGDSISLIGVAGLTYSWSTGKVSQSIIVKTANTYSLTVTDGNGCKASSVKTITVNALPNVTANASQTKACYGTMITLSGGGASSYSWTGGVTNGVAFSGNATNTYTVAGTDANSCTKTASVSVEIKPLPVAPNICMVTVNDASTHNRIVWEKPIVTNIDSFIVYRETYTDVYKQIGAVKYSDLSEFLDTVQTKYFPFTGDPNSGTYRYKLAVRDTCGNYSSMSPYHNTIFAQMTNGTFVWNDYKIEGQSIPVPGLASYELLRDNNSTGVFNVIGSVSGSQTTITDPAYASYSSGSWKVETVWSTTCNPTLKTASTYNRTKSNITKGSVSTSIETKIFSSMVSIYPNPANGEVNVSFPVGYEKYKISVFNTVGSLVYVQDATSGKYVETIDVSNLPAGMYSVSIQTEKVQVFKKLIVQK